MVEMAAIADAGGRFDVATSSPEAAARALLAGEPSTSWLDRYVEELVQCRGGTQLRQVLAVWQVSQAEYALMVGVTRQAVGKWLNQLPPDRAVAVADLAAATDILLHYVRGERIPAVVRRPSPALGGASLLDLVSRGDTKVVLSATRAMFDVSSLH